MSPVSRGFRGLCRTPAGAAGRLPPGQYITQDFPVLSAGPTPHTPPEDWTFSLTQGSETKKSWTWRESQALPAETITGHPLRHIRATATVCTTGQEPPDWPGHRAWLRSLGRAGPPLSSGSDTE
jgi:DMSO/TMAO reductase YedYZ molybdopterin-dependent catalytic subunit